MSRYPALSPRPEDREHMQYAGRTSEFLDYLSDEEFFDLMDNLSMEMLDTAFRGSRHLDRFTYLLLQKVWRDSKASEGDAT